MNLALVSALLGLLSTLTGFALYFSKAKKNSAPKTPVGVTIGLLVGLFLGAHALSLFGGLSLLLKIAVVLPFIFTLLLGSVFFFFLLQKNPPLNEIKVKQGDSLLPFKSSDANGHFFASDDLAGKRVLLKFYRGSWCPYCSAELKMFDEMQDYFAKYGVQIIALSTDTVEQAKMHIERDNLNMRLLSDPQLAVIKQYGVEHHKALSLDSTNVKTIFGIGLPFSTPSYRPIAIPTSILVDEHGVIQWIDQSEDYRLRASHSSVMSALQNAFSDKQL